MPTTSNFGWTTPADTDLVKDGAAAIRTLGNGIDTSFLDLKGGTTNQVLAKNSNTDLDFKWVADATGIPATIFDAKGDIIAATAADTADRLAVGANNTVLTADSSTATGLKWATPSSGSMTLLNTGGTTLTGAFVEITSIPSTYQQLYIVVNSFLPATDNRTLRMRTNVSTSNYAVINQGDSQGITGTDASWEIIPASDDTTTKSIFVGYIPDYANTTTYKFVFPFMGISTNPTTTTAFNYDDSRFKVLNNTAAVTSLRFFANSGNMTSGTVYVYGVK